MSGIKRKSATVSQAESKSKSKKFKVDKASSKRSSKPHTAQPAKSSKKAKADGSDELIESDTSEEENGFFGFSADKESAMSSSEDDSDVEMGDGSEEAEDTKGVRAQKRKGIEGSGEAKKKTKGSESEESSKLAGLNATSSREAHAKQKALAKERKAAKPNADIVERSKKLWEKLRLKSHIQKDERNELVKELFEIVTGRVKELVFKHDSVRVIQCAIKYSTMDQRRSIARELKGEFKTLAEGKYSKFLIAKLLEKGDPEIRDLIISEFYGHVKRLINHPEAAWILDDTYRQVATPAQKSRLLREWYGPEFSIKGLNVEGSDTADLAVLLQESPEKRKPIMDHLEIQINSLIQKKLTGFTMLHDAMLQYFLACKPGSSESTEFLEHLKPDATLKEGEEADNVDLLKNLAFTKSGSRLVSLCFAHGTAKDRKLFLRPYKDTMELMAYDQNAHQVLIAAMAVIDDTKLSSKSIFSELLPNNDTMPEKVLNLVNDFYARTVLLYPYVGDAKWLSHGEVRERLTELYAIRSSTSKKDPNTRLQELVRAIEPQLLSALTARAEDFASFIFGLQFTSAVLLGAPEVEPAKRKEALTEIARLSKEIRDLMAPNASGVKVPSSFGKNTLKTLVQGGTYDAETKKVNYADPPLGFADMFWDVNKDDVMEWALSPASFVIVGLLEAPDFTRKDELVKILKKERKALAEAAKMPPEDKEEKAKKQKQKRKKGEMDVKERGNAGARILLLQIAN